MGYEVAMAIEDELGRRRHAARTVTSAAVMSPADLEATVVLPARATRFTLTQTGGLLDGARLVTLANPGREAVTVVAGTESNGGPQDVFVNGTTRTTYLLPPGQARSFVVRFDGDAAGSNSILVEAPTE